MQVPKGSHILFMVSEADRLDTQKFIDLPNNISNGCNIREKTLQGPAELRLHNLTALGFLSSIPYESCLFIPIALGLLDSIIEKSIIIETVLLLSINISLHVTSVLNKNHKINLQIFAQLESF